MYLAPRAEKKSIPPSHQQQINYELIMSENAGAISTYGVYALRVTIG